MANIGWGLQMTVLGLGLVFALLALLWGLLSLVLVFDQSTPDNAARGMPEVGDAPAAAGADERPSLSGARVAAIAIAVTRHRQFLRRAERVPVDGPVVANPPISPWQLAGRVRQNKDWQPGGKR